MSQVEPPSPFVSSFPFENVEGNLCFVLSIKNNFEIK